MTGQPKSFITVFAAAQALGLAESTLSRQIAAGLIRRHRKGVVLDEVVADRAKFLKRGAAKSGRPSAKDATVAEPALDRPVAKRATRAGRPKRDSKAAQWAKSNATDKEYAAKLRQLEFEERSGKLMDRVAAERVFFQMARDNRDAWLTWPARIATLLAAEIGADARLLTDKLGAHVRDHLRELGEEPDPFNNRRSIS